MSARPRYLLCSTALLVVVAVVPVGVGAVTDLAPERGHDLRRVLDVGTALLAFAVFVWSVDRRSTDGGGARLWAAIGALLVGIAAAADPGILGALLASGEWREPLLQALSGAAMTVALAAFAVGLFDWTGPRPLPSWPSLAAAVAVALVALTTVFRMAPGLAEAVTVPAEDGGRGAAAVVADVAVAVLWIGVALAFFASRRSALARPAWLGLLLSALAASQVARALADGGIDDPLSVSAAALQGGGMLVALVGCWLAAGRFVDDQGNRLRDAEVEAETFEVRERLRRSEARRQRHDVANLITTIEGAAFVLERDYERLSAEDRALMRGVLHSGTARLRALLCGDGQPGTVSIADAVAGVVKERESHHRVLVDVPAGLTAAGSEGEVVEALRQVLTHACLQASGQPVAIRAERDGDRVVLRVEAGGPALPGPSSSLMVAARLLRASGGEVSTEPRTGGGASFRLSLPVATDADATAEGDAGRAEG